MSILSSLFKKNINRHIEGVVKADDVELENLKNEVEEYVLTSSIEKKLEDLLGAYFEKRSGGNGYWISGFFGSGKSHLLKMVALLLENKQLGDKTVAGIFLEKCSKDNAFLKGYLQKLTSQSQSVLFDISKVANESNNKDNVLEIFVNQFNKACGYCDTSREIAQFERELDEEGLLGRFKDEFKNKANIEWKDGRIRQRYRPTIDEVYNSVHNKPAGVYSNVLEKTKDENPMSIEVFARLVKDYINQKGPAFRINFFADEVGQYIGDKVYYMLELQAITEKLGVECQGRASVFVTSQAQIASFLEGMGTNLSKDDFSKIRGRFETKIHLDSQDVEEVIQRRLLEKQDNARQELSALYREQVNNFKTLFDFTGGRTFEKFKDEEHFIDCYPFIPYQFGLFQEAMLELSQHNAFQGQYTSVGARSILGVFQQVAIELSKNSKIGDIATFDMMYSGISSALAKFQSSIANAEKTLDNQLAVKILKALFLVKYIKTFKATPANIIVLMHGSFYENQVEFTKQVEDALNLLESQTYIQRTNDIYEFLTDKEQEIEQDIKKTEISITDVPEELQKFIYDGILQKNKIRSNGTDYPFTRKLDDRTYYREYELAINIITPLSGENTNPTGIRMKSISNGKELVILLAKDKKLFEDLELYKKTEKYLRQNTNSGQSDEVRRIVQNKSQQNSERYNRLQERIAEVLGKSCYYVSGSEIEKTGSDAAGCIIKAFSELISKNYTNLRMLRGITYSDKELDSIIDAGDTMSQPNLSEAEQEVFNFIFLNNTYKSTVKSVLENFKKIPYGWSEAAILCQIAHLYARRKIEIKENSNILEDGQVAGMLRNTAKQENLLLSAAASFTPNQIRQLKDFYQNFCNEPIEGNDAKIIAGKVNSRLKDKSSQIDSLLALKDEYPFIGALESVKTLLRQCVDKPYSWYFKEFSDFSSELLDRNVDLISPIDGFIHGTGKKYFDEAQSFLSSEKENLSAVNADTAKIEHLLSDSNCYKGNNIQTLRLQTEELRTQVLQELQTEKQKALAGINAFKTELTGGDDWCTLPAEAQNSLLGDFVEAEQNIERQNIIPLVKYEAEKFAKDGYAEILNKKEMLLHPALRNDADSAALKPAEIVVSATKLQIALSKNILSSEQDVDEYLANIRKAMLKEISGGKKIKI